ncbi:MAG: GntR family transcriptional regulator [Chloroflexi bacterium]|uniref:GntR family transcriptional regulator n=1 Tax=Candidatus Chlorohelix allophototropha TaxID=3003348 RepID=A0A8T7M1J3_9CHLR|nr:GntR family transcriptional regulator [Chloroflexota bacterium]WJW67859.1 GntR family transcriptional regulator [Chloroflexota bacterium L227-S17]
MATSKFVFDEIKQYKTSPDLIADSLRKAILSGEIKGGDYLRQEELASAFGVSRIPVREALRKLEAEGLIAIYPNRGAQVLELSPREVQELFEIRVALETAALRFALPTLSSQDLEQAALILEELERETEVGRWGELNRKFHLALYQPCARPRLLSIINSLHQEADRFLRLVLSAIEHQNRSQQEHRELLEACCQQDSEKALGLLQVHIKEAGELLVAVLNREIHIS